MFCSTTLGNADKLIYCWQCGVEGYDKGLLLMNALPQPEKCHRGYVTMETPSPTVDENKARVFLH